MQVGVAFPQTEIGTDPAVIRDYVQGAEDLGYTHLFIADHILGDDPQFHQQASNMNAYSRFTPKNQGLRLIPSQNCDPFICLATSWTVIFL